MGMDLEGKNGNQQRSSLCVVGGTYATLPPVWDRDHYRLVRRERLHTWPLISMYRHDRHDYLLSPYPYSYVVLVLTALMDGIWYGCPTAEVAHEAFEMACDRYLYREESWYE